MSENKARLKNRLTLLLVIGIFCVPVLYSWWVLHYTDKMDAGSKSSHGDLIIPPRSLPDLVLIDPLGQRDNTGLHGKWSLFYIVADQCDQACGENLYRMRQLRLTTGKDDHRVQRAMLFLQEDAVTAQTFLEYTGQWVVSRNNPGFDQLIEIFRLNPGEEPEKLHRLYIIDPLGNLMMSYPAGADPGGIIKDLKKLLKYSKIG